jgi:hypothetical protein
MVSILITDYAKIRVNTLSTEQWEKIVRYNNVLQFSIYIYTSITFFLLYPPDKNVST